MIQINQLATSVETGFNITNSIPVIAVPGSVLRTNVAQVQFVASAVFALIGFIGQMIQSGNCKWNSVFNNSCEHMIHGALNYFRGLGELLLAVTVVGSLALLAYQLSVKNGFAPIVKYDTSPLTQLNNATALAVK
ncbi:MAG: hypothetical protein K2Y01_03005 [Rhabdochlamydiaceae bacterium]|nr:hypothetical protein [Rhabdochlamydiaceae bacterium]